MNMTHELTDEREAFEAWCIKRWAGDRGALTKNQDGTYWNGNVDFAWNAWQAAVLAHLAQRGSEAKQPTKAQALKALDDMDYYARMTLGVDAVGPRETPRRFIEAKPDSSYSAQVSGDAATARALVDGYVGGACSVIGDAATASVTLHYMTGDQAEAAFDAIAAAIDAALSSTTAQGDGEQEAPRG